LIGLEQFKLDNSIKEFFDILEEVIEREDNKYNR
jgi:hypothetical protein